MMSIPVMLLKAIQQLERLALATENSREKKPPAPEDRPNVAKIFQNEKDFNPCLNVLAPRKDEYSTRQIKAAQYLKMLLKAHQKPFETKYKLNNPWNCASIN